MRTSVACAVIAAEVVTGIVALIVVSSSSSSSASNGPTTSASRTTSGPSSPTTPTTSGSTLSGSAAALVAWMRSALPTSTTLLADPQVAAELTRVGFTAVRTPGSGSGVGFVVSTPALRSVAGEQPAVATVLAGSLPVATAGTGDGQVDVRQVTSMTAAQLADDASTRRTAEQVLLSNANVTVSGASAAILRAGGLDLRPATFFALLSGNERIEFVAIRVDPLEQAAGRPARIIDVRVPSRASLDGMLSAVDPRYRVSSVVARPDGSLRLTWPVDVTSGDSAR